MIVTENITKFFHLGGFERKKKIIRAVENVSFNIEKGETLGLVGESGSGKTTTGRILLRLMPLTAGRVLFDGTDIFKLNSRTLKLYRRRMQIVFQDPYSSLNPRMTVKQIISEGMIIHGIGTQKERTDKVLKLLETVGLDISSANKYPHEFSGGQRQRIAIARAISLDPEFVVLDEPVSALDVSIQAQIINLLKDLQQKKNFTYLFISHDLAVVRHISHKIIVMYAGRVIEKGDSDNLFTSPLHPYTKLLLSSVPSLKGKSLKVNKYPDTESDIPEKGCAFAPRCPFCMERCLKETPQEISISPFHSVACFIY